MPNAAFARPLMIATMMFLIGCGGGGSGGTAGTGGGTGGSAAPVVVTPASFSVAAGAETTQCVVVDLGNATTIHVGEIRTTLGPPVYEVRIGATSGPAQTTPSACNPFGDIDGKDVRPLVLARAGNKTLDFVGFPTGVGYTLAAHQFLRIEVHAFNAGAGAVDTAVSVAFTPTPDGAFQQEAGLILFEENSISIPPQAVATVGPAFFPLSTVIGGATVAQLMGYTHKLGAAVKMETATSATDAAPQVIYEPSFDPENPVASAYNPPLVLPSPGGIDLTCWFSNTGTTQVVQDVLLTGERCAGVLYYYPATAVHRCIHVVEGGGGTICCPGSPSCPQG